MKILDLSLPLYNKMPVFEGDPDVEIKQIHFLEKEGWNLSSLKLTTHLGTHVNVPSHMNQDGKSINDYQLDDFIGQTRVFKSEQDIGKGWGILFSNKNITVEIAEAIIMVKPKFVLLSATFEFDVEIEKKLLEAGIISFENITNCELLPDEFQFYGVPLNIRDADGSPVRAFAEINQY
jgi:arylformamidase